MNNFKEIELGLENCESLIFKGVDVRVIEIESSDSAFNNELKLKNMFLVVSKDADTVNSYRTTWHSNKETPFDRITRNNDVCLVDVTDHDGVKTSYRIDWNYDDVHENRYQTSVVDSDGVLYVVVSNYTNVNNHFGLDSDNHINEIDPLSDIRTWPTREIEYGIEACEYETDSFIRAIAATSDVGVVERLIVQFNEANELKSRYEKELSDRHNRIT